MQMYAYYITKGHTLESLLSLSEIEKMFYLESMRFILEHEENSIRSALGGGK